MLIEIHMIQNHSPSNLNRDDLGAPKTCLFGGVTRARISSQCLKRSIRNPGNPGDIHNQEPGLFAKEVGQHIALRSKFFPDKVGRVLEEKGTELGITDGEERKKIVESVMKMTKEREKKGAAAESGEEDERACTPQLVFFERTEAVEMVRALASIREECGGLKGDYKKFVEWSWKEDAGSIKEKKKEKASKSKFLKQLRKAFLRRSVDIALFGRMTTSDAFEDVEAAMQVAHAISTHAAVNEVDYFTAVDDLGKGPGAGHVDEAMFASACFYKYFSLDWDQFVHNLAGPAPKRDSPDGEAEHKKWTEELKPNAEKLAAATLGHFLRAAAMTTPSGKQNSCAANNLPDGILVEIKKRAKGPVSYANAFADPVPLPQNPSSDRLRSLVSQSIAQLGQYVHDVAEGFGIPAERFWFSMNGRNPLNWIDGTSKEPDKQKPVIFDANDSSRMTPDREHHPATLDDLVSKVIRAATGMDWAAVCDVGKGLAAEA